ncbi:MAG: J domain-containing protein [Polyangiales bacterium]
MLNLAAWRDAGRLPLPNPCVVGMAERDFYKILGVSRTASEADIRKAYRTLARKYHPDKNPGNKAAEDKFKDISHARDILLNKKKRELYDEFGELGLKEGFDADAFRQYRGGRAAGGGGFGGGRDLSDLEELLGGLRGAGFGGRGGFGGFQDFVGGETVQELFRQGARGARGGAPAQKPETTSEVSLGFIEALRGGEREILLAFPGEKDPRSLKVRFPAGVKDGGQIRLRGQGIGGGDVVLKIHVEPHALLRREAEDLHLVVPVTVGEAYRGAKVSVPTLDGEVSLTVPRGAKSGAKLRLRGKGVPRGEGAGDMIVTIQVRLPEVENEAADQAIEELEKLYPASPRAGMKL